MKPSVSVPGGARLLVFSYGLWLVLPSPAQVQTGEPIALPIPKLDCGVATTGTDGLATIAFNPPFTAPPAVTCTAVSGSGGVTVTLVEVTATSFTVKTTIPSVEASASTYEHAHALSDEGMHIHEISITPGMVDDHAHALPAEPDHRHTIAEGPEHLHAISLEPNHAHNYSYASSMSLAGAHDHEYLKTSVSGGGVDSAAGGAGVAGGPYEKETSQHILPCPEDGINWLYRFYRSTENPSYYASCDHTHTVKIDQVIDHTHALSVSEVSATTSEEPDHEHFLTYADLPTSLAGSHDHGGLLVGGAHAHGGLTGFAGAHAHGGATALDGGFSHLHTGTIDPALDHTHTAAADSHTHTVTVSVGTQPVAVEFHWIACKE